MINLNNKGNGLFVAGACGMSQLQVGMNKEMSVTLYINECERLTNEYIVPCSVFTFNGKTINEAVKGFFVGEENYKDDVKKCKAKLMELTNAAILMRENKGVQTYQAGVIYESLSEVPSDISHDAIFNIKGKSYLTD